MGNVLSAGVGQAPARQAALVSGFIFPPFFPNFFTCSRRMSTRIKTSRSGRQMSVV
jgi:hypothetical protein